MIRTFCLAMVLASGAGLAGSPAECAAQTGSQQPGMSLSAAIEEARRSPFHAVSGLRAPWEARLSEMGIDATPASNPLRSGSQEERFTGTIVGITLISAGVSHLAAVHLFFNCADDASHKSSVVGCIVGPLIPLPAVAIPPASVGVGAGKVFKASAYGLLGGAAAFSLTLLASERISRYGAGLIGSFIHFLTMSALIR